ncbi:MAG: hypothetical protein R2789_12445 [Microthrixaceae bacterium]
MAADDRLLAPVLSQPSMPLAVSAARRRSIDIGEEELERVKHRCANEGLEVVGLRFKTDRLVPSERFDFLRAARFGFHRHRARGLRRQPRCKRRTAFRAHRAPDR